MPFFSVIIPTYNRVALLREALVSVFTQTLTDYEVIVVDDGSTDETSRVLESYEKRVRTFSQQNQGPGAARNLGIEQAKGDYIAFLDSDDVWFPWTLEAYHHAINQSPQPAFVSGREIKFTESDPPVASSFGETRLIRFADYLSTSRESLWIGTCSVAIKTAEVKAVGKFISDHVNAEDSDLWLRLGTSPGFVRIESPPVFGHRQTSGSAVSFGEKTYLGVLKMLESEKAGRYPGGAARKRDRWRILSRHVRPACLGLLREQTPASALTLYRQSFAINLALGRIKFLLGFWPLLSQAFFGRKRR